MASGKGALHHTGATGMNLPSNPTARCRQGERTPLTGRTSDKGITINKPTAHATIVTYHVRAPGELGLGGIPRACRWVCLGCSLTASVIWWGEMGEREAR